MTERRIALSELVKSGVILLHDFKNESHRIYGTLRDGEKEGFEVFLVEFFEGSARDIIATLDKSAWNCENIIVNVLCEVTAYFDGIRHISMPYVNYPNVAILTRFFDLLNTYEKNYCWDYCLPEIDV